MYWSASQCMECCTTVLAPCPLSAIWPAFCKARAAFTISTRAHAVFSGRIPAPHVPCRVCACNCTRHRHLLRCHGHLPLQAKGRRVRLQISSSLICASSPTYFVHPVNSLYAGPILLTVVDNFTTEGYIYTCNLLICGCRSH